MQMPPLPLLAGEATLRRLSPSDLADFQAYRNDPGIGLYQGMSDPEASAFLSEMNLAPLLQPGVWSQIGIADSQSLRLIGDIGLFLAADSQQAEVGITLERQA